MLTTREAKIKFNQELLEQLEIPSKNPFIENRIPTSVLKVDKESVDLIKIDILPMVRRIIAIHDGLVLDVHCEVKAHVKKAIDYAFKKISPDDPRNALQDIFSHLQNTELELQSACNIARNKHLKQDLHHIRDEIFCIYQKLPKETRMPLSTPDTQLAEKSQSPEELKKAMDSAATKAEETLATKNPKQAVLLYKLDNWAQTTIDYLKSKSNSASTAPTASKTKKFTGILPKKISDLFSRKSTPYTTQIELIELFKGVLDTINQHDAKLNPTTVALIQQMLDKHLGSPLNCANECEIQTLHRFLQKLHDAYSPPKPSVDLIRILRDIGL